MAILPRLNEKAKSAIDDYMKNVIELNEIAPLEIIMRFLKIRKVLIDERSVINYVETNYPGYLVIDFEPYDKILDEIDKAVGGDTYTIIKLTAIIMSKDNKDNVLV